MCIYIYIYIFICLQGAPALAKPNLGNPRFWVRARPARGVLFYIIRSVFIISNRKYVAYLSVLSQISNCQGLGRKNKHEMLKTDRVQSITLCYIMLQYNSICFVMTQQLYCTVVCHVSCNYIICNAMCIYIYIYIYIYTHTYSPYVI